MLLSSIRFVDKFCRLVIRIHPRPMACNAISLHQVNNLKKVEQGERRHMSSVDVIGIRKSYGAQEVIHGVDINIADGEFVILVGPSGCGKSTLLRMIAGLEPITSGDIRIGDAVVNNLPPKDRDIAMVFQTYALYPHKTVAENMGFALKLRKAPKSEITARVTRAAEILDLVPYLSRYPRQLSGGQRQRVAMGRAIVRDPKVFLFDEPLSNLDAKLRVQMRAEIKELHQRLKTTTIYVTHDQVEAMTMADRIVVMNAGVVEQVGTPLELYDRPANIFVASFIGSPAMNLIKGTIQGKNKPSFVTEDGFKLPLASAPSGSDGRPAIYGIRPEHFSLGGSVKAEVAVTEPTGSETQVIAKLGKQKIVGVFRERIVTKPGETLAMTPNPGAAHLFDHETGKNLSP
jgi:multiple sugar transport system ATP-binding protein